MKLWILIVLIVKAAIVRGDLYCYVCEDCEEIEGLEPQLCEPNPSLETSIGKITTKASDEDTESSSSSTPSLSTSTIITTIDFQESRNSKDLSSNTTVHLRKYRSLLNFGRAGSSYACISITIKGCENNGRGKVYRDCLEIPADKTGCEYYLEQNRLPESETDNCYVCYKDGCNGSATINVLSVLVILLMAVLRVLN